MANNTYQLTPQDKWQQNNGLIAKSYKLKRELVAEFKHTCETIGISQAGAISSFMSDFIANHTQPSE